MTMVDKHGTSPMRNSDSDVFRMNA